MTVWNLWSSTSAETGQDGTQQAAPRSLGPVFWPGRIRISPVVALFIVILLLGVFARIWEFGSLPPGLGQDEASNGVDAFSLYRFGMDRNGDPFPVHFVSWGSGQDVLYAYLIIPFIALGGLNPLMVRLPMLLSGILILPLMYVAARRSAGQTVGLIAMFLLAISPWHIMWSRWGNESTLLPFVFLLGFSCLLKSSSHNAWFVAATFFLALSLYAYGTAYAAVPVVVACAVLILRRWHRVSLRNLLIGLGVLVITGTPIGLYILGNWFNWDTIRLGPITIPSLTSEARYETLIPLGSEAPLLRAARNLHGLLKLLWEGTDYRMHHVIEPYGYGYPYTLPLAIIGIVLLIPWRDSRRIPERLLWLSWLLAALLTGALVPANINRVNLIYIPLVFCTATCLGWLAGRWKGAFALALCAFVVAFVLFTRDYHSEEYRREIQGAFYSGLLPALDFARNAGDNPICVSNEVDEGYIFAWFVEPEDPLESLKRMTVEDPNAAFRRVGTLGRYGFRMDDMENCVDGPRTIYVLHDKESPPDPGLTYDVARFGLYRVLVP